MAAIVGKVAIQKEIDRAQLQTEIGKLAPQTRINMTQTHIEVLEGGNFNLVKDLYKAHIPRKKLAVSDDVAINIALQKMNRGLITVCKKVASDEAKEQVDVVREEFKVPLEDALAALEKNTDALEKANLEDTTDREKIQAIETWKAEVIEKEQPDYEKRVKLLEDAKRVDPEKFEELQKLVEGLFDEDQLDKLKKLVAMLK